MKKLQWCVFLFFSINTSKIAQKKKKIIYSPSLERDYNYAVSL